MKPTNIVAFGSQPNQPLSSTKNYFCGSNNPSTGDVQLELFPIEDQPKPLKPRKPQVQSIKGVPATRRDRYEVVDGDRVIATGLKLGEASAIAKLQSFKKRKSLTNALEFLEKRGIEGEDAIFLLSQVDGGEA